MTAGLMVGPEKKERVNVRIGPRIEEAMVAVLGRLLMVVGGRRMEGNRVFMEGR